MAQIRVSEPVREMLKAMGKKGETYDEIIIRLSKNQVAKNDEIARI